METMHIALLINKELNVSSTTSLCKSRGRENSIGFFFSILSCNLICKQKCGWDLLSRWIYNFAVSICFYAAHSFWHCCKLLIHKRWPSISSKFSHHFFPHRKWGKLYMDNTMPQRYYHLTSWHYKHTFFFFLHATHSPSRKRYCI